MAYNGFSESEGENEMNSNKPVNAVTHVRVKCPGCNGCKYHLSRPCLRCNGTGKIIRRRK